jgi:hypothetical protein
MDLVRSLARATSSTGKVKYDGFLANVRRDSGFGRFVMRSAKKQRIGYAKEIIPCFVRGCNSVPVPVAMLAFLGCWFPLLKLTDDGFGRLLVFTNSLVHCPWFSRRLEKPQKAHRYGQAVTCIWLRGGASDVGCPMHDNG